MSAVCIDPIHMPIVPVKLSYNTFFSCHGVKHFVLLQIGVNSRITRHSSGWLTTATAEFSR